MNVGKDSSGKDTSGEPLPEESGAHPVHPKREESELFAPPAGPRYFGTGSYEGGGTHTGSYALGDVNRQGGYGTFTDAGGPGSTELLGEEPEEGEEPSAEDEPERK
jgi:hypothetical protein